MGPRNTRVVRLLMTLALTTLANVRANAQSGAWGAAKSRAELVTRLDSLARDRSSGYASASVAVLRGRDTLLLRAYGLADREPQRPATTNTTYEIASLTKQITASAIMRLVEQGKLSLDDDVGKFVPQFPLAGKHVTVRQLLNHTSGIHNHTAEPHTASATDSHEIVLDWIATHPFDFTPGERMAYSNTGYTLLGMIIEKVTGQPYAHVVQGEFFGPLGLSRTRYCDSDSTDPTVARGYEQRDSGLVRVRDVNMNIPYAAGAICSTAGDYAEFERAFLEGRVVGAASKRRMLAPDTLRGGTVVDYGFGLGLGHLGSHAAFTHSGGITGFSSAQLVLPQDSLVIVVFTNTESRYPMAEPLAFDLARLVIGYAPNGFGALDRPGHESKP